MENCTVPNKVIWNFSPKQSTFPTKITMKKNTFFPSNVISVNLKFNPCGGVKAYKENISLVNMSDHDVFYA